MRVYTVVIQYHWYHSCTVLVLQYWSVLALHGMRERLESYYNSYYCIVLVVLVDLVHNNLVPSTAL